MAGCSIKLFQTIKKLYKILGIELPQANETIALNSRNLCVLFCYAQFVISAGGFFIFEAKTVEEYGSSFFMFSTQLYITFDLLILMWHIPNIMELIAAFEEFIDKRLPVANDAKKMYNELNEKIEQLSEWLCVFGTKANSVAVYLPPLATFIIDYLTDNLTDKSFFLPYPVLLPFSYKTSFGYLLTLVLQAAADVGIMICGLTVVAFFVGSAWTFITFIDDIAIELKNLNKIAHNSNADQHEMKQKFCTMFQLYSDVKQFIGELNASYEPLVFSFISWALLSISSSLLVLNSIFEAFAESNQTDLINALLYAFWSILAIFLFCEFGQMVSERLEAFHDQLCHCDWYVYPMEIQRLYLMFLVNTQQEATLKGYANISCTRDMFKATMKGAFSYFMTLRQVD